MQTTCILGKDLRRFKDSINAINQLYNIYLSTENKNKLVPIAIKYRIRHIFLNMLKNKQYETIKSCLEILDASLRKELYSLTLITNKKLRYIFIAYFYFTKILWRLHRFPIVGQKSKYNKKFIASYKKLQK